MNLYTVPRLLFENRQLVGLLGEVLHLVDLVVALVLALGAEGVACTVLNDV